jgi:hypothetical protein
MEKTGEFREGESRQDLDMTKIADINKESELNIYVQKIKPVEIIKLDFTITSEGITNNHG